MEQQSLYNSTSFSNHGLDNVNILSTLLRPTAQKKKKKIPFKRKREKQLLVYKETLGIGMGNTCNSMADSCQCMTKPTTIL